MYDDLRDVVEHSVKSCRSHSHEACSDGACGSSITLVCVPVEAFVFLSLTGVQFSPDDNASQFLIDRACIHAYVGTCAVALMHEY